MSELLLVVVGAYAAYVYFRKQNTAPMVEVRYFCNSCKNTTSNPIRKGNGWIEFVLYLCYLIPGIIYSIWRRSGPPNVCPICKTAGVVPEWAAKPPAAGKVEAREERECPHCAERILVKAKVCKHCGKAV